MSAEAWLFWTALLGLVPLGVTFSLQPKKDPRRRVGLALMPIGLLIAAAVAASMHSTGAVTPEVELVAVLIHLLPIGALLGIGAMIAVFGGPTPVGEIPPIWRLAGFLAMTAGISALWYVSTSYAPAVALDTGLLASWPRIAMASLLTITVVAWLGFGFTIVMGSDRYLAAGVLGAIGVVGLAVIQQALGVASFRNGMVGALDDLAGITLGLIAAATVFGVLVVQTERRMTPMEPVPELSDAERIRAIEILSMGLVDELSTDGGGEEE